MSIRSNQFGPKIQIKYIDTKNQLADILTKGNFTRDEWNHMLCLFSISHFCPNVCSRAMAKRLHQDSGEERVTAKLRPLMNLIARTPSFMSSSSSASLGTNITEIKIHGHQLLEKIDQGNLVVNKSCLGNSLQQIIQNWITTVLGLLKSGELRLRRTIDQGNLIKLLGEGCNKFVLVTKNRSRRNRAIRKVRRTTS